MEYKCKEGMIDNRMVHDDHQQGIKRVLQKHHNPLDYEGHHGSMKGGWKHGIGEHDHRGKHADHFKRANSAMTPRKA